MNIRKPLLGIMATALISGSIFNVSYAADNKKTADIPPITAEQVVIQEEYHLLNDSSGIYNSSDRQHEEEELKKIFSTSEDKTSALRIYTFIYDSLNKNITSVENELIQQANLDNSITPIIFIYNKSDNDYKFIIDDRIASYVSKAYLQNEYEQLITSKESPSVSDFNEFLERISTIIVAASNQNITSQTDLASADMQIDESKFEIRDFNKIKLSDTTSKDKNDSSDRFQNTNTSNDTTGLLFCCTIILVFIAGAVAYKRKNLLNKHK